MRDAAEGVRTALRVVVRDHGRRVAEDPSRVRALLLDALGPQALAARSEIDAIVVAAEEGVAALIDGSPRATEAARRTLLQRGLSTTMADFAVGCWEFVLVADPAARTAGASATVPGPVRPADQPSDRPANRLVSPPAGQPPDRAPSRPGARPTDRGREVAPTEIPLPSRPRSPGSPGVPAAGEPVTGTPAAVSPARRWPPILTVSRSTTVVAGAASLAVAFSLGFFGSGAVSGDADGTASLTAGPVSTPATVTNTAVVRVTTVQTKPVTKSVTRTVTVDASKLKALSDRFTTQPYVVWAGNRTCALKAPAKAKGIRACYGIYRVRATGTQKSWKVLSATVTGRGRVVPNGKDVNFYYVLNGPSTATISFVVGSGSYRSKGTLRIQLECNRNLGCGKALP